ncbi:MAG: putative nucleotidyltransferase [uncultured archaeon A07HN63]|jgi:Nucleotidyltransferase domain.|nr:MAG: putative nucleotidyltransferase [uncultured archaeon A07HN63]
MESGAEDSQVDSVLDMSVCADPTVEFVVVFGSQCTGEATPASDIDVAIKFADDLSASERFEKRCFLSGDIQRDDAPFIDLSDIETLPLGVAHDAVNGTFVCGDEHAFERFKTAIEAAFDDRRDTLRRQQRDVIDRIAAEGLRG